MTPELPPIPEDPSQAPYFARRDGIEGGSGGATGASENTANTDWWQQALALEQMGCLSEAEQLINSSLPPNCGTASIVELYRRRMLRLKELGDEAGALEAFLQSANRSYYYSHESVCEPEYAERPAQFYNSLLQAYGGRREDSAA